MKLYRITPLIIFCIALLLSACEDYVLDVPEYEDIITDEMLIDSTDIEFLVNGIKANFSSTVERVIMFGDLLDDQLIFDPTASKDATYSTFREIETGNIQLNNNSVDALAYNMGEMWFFSVDLISRINNRIDTPEHPISDELKNYGLMNAYLYAGISCEIYAGFFGLEEGGGGGGCLNAGPFIPEAAMYDSALANYTKALDYTSGAAEDRIIHSLMARVYLYQGDWANAKSQADMGMQQGDAPFRALYAATADNYMWQQGSIFLRCQVIVDDRFAEYIEADPLEANRISIVELPDDLKAVPGDTTVYWTQSKYNEDSSPVTYMSWQENSLMLAELAALRGQGGDPVSMVNAVRTSHGLGDVSTVDEDIIIAERDKELFLTGQRLVDQRRFDIWHLGAGTWKYLPITEKERNANPNID